MPHLSILYTVTYYFNFPVHIYMIKVGMPGARNSPELLTTVMDGYNCCTNFQGLGILWCNKATSSALYHDIK